MTTRELIQMLSDADPSGDLPCCVSNREITHVERLPAYYDGALQVLNRDGKGRVISAGRTNAGDKICIRTMSIADVIFDDVDFPVGYEGVGAGMAEWYRKQDDEAREEARKIDKEIELSKGK